MLCRALLTALAVSYLICVLLLSGLQKEDLDVSMLRKLQRYNVNIDDMNNEQQRSECLSNDKGITMDRANIDHKFTTTEEPTTTTKDPFQGLNMETVLNYLITERKLQQESTTLAREPSVTKEPYIRQEIETRYAAHKQPRLDLNVLQRYINLNRENETGDIVIIKTTVTPTDDGILQNNINTEQKRKQKEKEEFINQLLKDYFLQKQFRSTTIQYTTTQTVDMRSVYKKIDEFIANNSKRKKPNKESYQKEQIRDSGAEQYFDGNIEKAAPTVTQEIKTAQNSPIKNIQDFLTAMNQYKTYYPFLAYNQNQVNPRNKVQDNSTIKNIVNEELPKPQDNKISNKEIQEIKIFQDFLTAINKFKTFNPFLAYNQNNDATLTNNNVNKNDPKRIETKQDVKMMETVTESNKLILRDIKDELLQSGKNLTNNLAFQQDNAITPDLVKKIAETVKDVIIKDLRKEISQISFKPIQTTTVGTTILTTEKITTTTLPVTTSAIINRNSNNIAIMDKFMELFEQIKSLQQNTYMLKLNNYSDPSTTEKLQNFRSTASPQLSPFFYYKGLQNPETGAPFPPVDSYNLNKRIAVSPYYTTQRKHRPSPLTIQTNSVEIQPLAIPISKPQSLINQNIIVPPTHTFESSNEHNSWQHIPRENRYLNMRISDRNAAHKPIMKQHDNYKQPHPVHTNSKVPKHYADDIIRFRISNNGDSKFGTDYYEKINLGNYKPVPRVNDENLVYKKLDTPRFHERLENANERIVDVPDRDITIQAHTDDDIPPRQQLSLTDMKKGSSYDDTHFKNFLNTQQKVTNMLEKILANRPKTNTPRSVEAL